MLQDLKRKYIKVNDITRNIESGVMSFVRAINIIDDIPWAICQLDRNDRLVLVKASKLQAVRIQK